MTTPKTPSTWAASQTELLECLLRDGRTALARAELVARCFKGPNPEQALLAAGVDALAADDLVRRAAVFGYRNTAPEIRRVIKRLEKRLAGVRAFAEPRWTVRDHDLTDPAYSFGEFAQENEAEARAFFERGRALAKVNGGAAQLKRNGVVVDAYSHFAECA
jgi:hypothetical protein